MRQNVREFAIDLVEAASKKRRKVLIAETPRKLNADAGRLA